MKVKVHMVTRPKSFCYPSSRKVVNVSTGSKKNSLDNGTDY